MRTPRVWIYMADPRTTADMADLAHQTDLTWGANPFTSKGDVVLMYRCWPYSDIAYAFTAISQPRATKPSDGTDSPYAIDLGGKVALTHPLTLHDLKREASLAKWSFVRNQQGVMRRKLDLTSERVWLIVFRMIRRSNPHFKRSLSSSRRHLRAGPATGGSRNHRVLHLFISYARADKAMLGRFETRLRQEGFIDPWLDIRDIAKGDRWKQVIEAAIKKCEAAVVFISPNVRPGGYIHKEIKLLRERFARAPSRSPSLFPAKLAPSELPATLSTYQAAELYRPGEYERLVGQLALKVRTARTPRQPKTPVP